MALSYRTLMFIKNMFGGVVPDCTLGEELNEVLVRVNRELARYTDCLERLRIRDGLKHILTVSRVGNGLIQAVQPWKLVKGTAKEVLVIIILPYPHSRPHPLQCSCWECDECVC